MAMPLWLGRPREFEQLDKAINNLCRAGNTAELDGLCTRLDEVVKGADVIDGFLGLKSASNKHFRKHWVGNYKKCEPPVYWPYAWSRDPHAKKERVLIDRLMAFGMMCSIQKMSAACSRARETSATSAYPSHFTVWICLRALTDDQEALAYADREYRKKLFRIGVVESRDTVAFVITTPHPGEHNLAAGVIPGFEEPVIVTTGFTKRETPVWQRPGTEAAPHTAGGAGHGGHA